MTGVTPTNDVIIEFSGGFLHDVSSTNEQLRLSKVESHIQKQNKGTHSTPLANNRKSPHTPVPTTKDFHKPPSSARHQTYRTLNLQGSEDYYTK